MKNVDKTGVIQEARALKKERARLDEEREWHNEKVEALKKYIQRLPSDEFLSLWKKAKKAGGLDPEIRAMFKTQEKIITRGWSMML